MGNEITETFETAVLEQPLLVPITVKLIFETGETDKGLLTEPVFQL